MYIYTCKKFGIKELVSPGAYAAHGDKCWRWFDPVTLQGLDKLREKFGPCYINTWGLKNPAVLGQVYSFSGFHLPGEFKRSEFSGHRAWGAFDLKFVNHTAESVRKQLLGKEPTVAGVLPSIPGFEEITEIEYGVNWFHVRFGSNIKGVLVYPVTEGKKVG